MVPVLTYHSQNIRGAEYAANDHVALAADLQALHDSGFKVISLDRLLDWLDGDVAEGEIERSVVLTFDDGCDFDVHDLNFPGHGLQRSFLGILEDHHANTGAPLHATSFVIASSDARWKIDSGSLFGKGWISDDWWADADAHEMLSVENHGWDHNHPDLAGPGRGGFQSIDSHEECLEQVVRAAAAIEGKTGRWPRHFAYPFGESSAYIRDSFFPVFQEVHGCRAALGTEPGHVKDSSDRWNLPRFVCGRDWRSSQQLLELVSQP